jgi:putative hydroxymethylpyrimidine transport system substrate-binding protein
VPAYDELIYVAHRDSLQRPELRGFLDAVERATHWLINHPEEAWEVFKASDPDLDDELNRRAWLDTCRASRSGPMRSTGGAMRASRASWKTAV